MHVVGMIKFITTIFTHTVILELFVLTIDNFLIFNRQDDYIYVSGIMPSSEKIFTTCV